MKKLLNILIIVSLVIFSSCKKEEEKVFGCTSTQATNYNIDADFDDGSCKYNLSIKFTHTVEGWPLEINQMIYMNAAGENYNVQTLRYLISDIRMHSANGSSVLLDEVHFITIANPETFNLTIQDLNDPGFTAISFTMGLDSTKNITDLYLNESFFPSFAWPISMGGGYHYMQLEGDFINPLQGYATHTGGTNGEDYSFSKNFPYVPAFAGPHDTLESNEIIINMEINNWYSNPNIINFTTDGIMDNPNKQALLQANGIADVFSVYFGMTTSIAEIK